jgi:hypothetical protein
VDLFIGLGFVALAVLLYALMLNWGLRRGRRRSAAATGAHDLGVQVDEAAWAEIVKQLTKGNSRDKPRRGQPRERGSR